MTWIPLHQSVWTHRKTYLLAAALGIDPDQAVIHLAKLWTWALDNAPVGVLSAPDMVVALAAGWRGSASPAAFVETLVTTGFVDRAGEALLLHNWDQYGGKLATERAAKAAAGRAGGAASAMARGKHRSNTAASTAVDVPVAPLEQRMQQNEAEERRGDQRRSEERSAAKAADPGAQARAAAAAAPDGTSGMAEIAKTWLDAMGQPISDFGLRRLEVYAARASPDAVVAAIQDAADHGAKTSTYVHRILDRVLAEPTSANGAWREPTYFARRRQAFAADLHPDPG